MTRLLVAGYKHFELGIFQDKDPRLLIIREAIKKELVSYLENGLEWLVFTGELGFAYWVLEEAAELRKIYDFQMAAIFPFENHGEKWSPASQEKLAKFKSLDFVKAAYPCYSSPDQFRSYHRFLIDNTDQAFLFYDRESPTKLGYLYDLMQERENYPVKSLTFDDLNALAENF